MSPTFHVQRKPKAFPKISSNSQMASILLVKFDGKLQRLQLIYWLAILLGLFSFWIKLDQKISHFPNFQQLLPSPQQTV